ncbi:MAG TPA: DUF2304 domain-containing protein [Rudaea sp.]|nr:DUF2304 domain-containing protein [Rudaea sp.]
MTAQITAGIIGALLAGTILFLVRRDHLHGSYALWWLVVAAAILVLGVFPPVIDWLGHVTGIYYPPVLPIVIGIGMILVRMLKMDIDRSRTERQVRRLTQKLAILEQELAQARRDETSQTQARSAQVIALQKSGRDG